MDWVFRQYVFVNALIRNIIFKMKVFIRFSCSVRDCIWYFMYHFIFWFSRQAGWWVESKRIGWGRRLFPFFWPWLWFLSFHFLGAFSAQWRGISFPFPWLVLFIFLTCWKSVWVFWYLLCWLIIWVINSLIVFSLSHH